MRRRCTRSIRSRFATLACVLAGALVAGCSAGGDRSSAAAREESGDAHRLEIGGATLHVSLESGLPLDEATLLEWVRRCAVAITGVYGHFPVPEVEIEVLSGADEAVGEGVTYGAARIRVHLGAEARKQDLWDDWVLTHEMVHLAFPDLGERYLWMNEGLADYLEPFARARVGEHSESDVWLELVEGLPRGQPRRGDGGLDGAGSRERIYWGGALYWFLADLELRERTGNRHGVEDVARAVLAAGGNGAANWPLERVFEVGRQATGTDVLREVHARLGSEPVRIDLAAIWKRLGVQYRHGRVSFDDSAELASIRKSMTVRR